MNSLTDEERDQCETITSLREMLGQALAQKRTTVTLELSVFVWLNILDEVFDRRPRNYSRLLADDTLDRLNEAINRLHVEANLLIAAGPSQAVAERFLEDAEYVESGRVSPRVKRAGWEASKALHESLLRNPPRTRDGGDSA